jgi:hypothetical protein
MEDSQTCGAHSGRRGVCHSRGGFAKRAGLPHRRSAVRLTLFFFFSAALTRAFASVAIEINLTAQKAFLLQDGQIVYESPISSGRPGFPTPTGNFAVLEKDENHLSSLYGTIFDASGRTVTANGDAAMPVPKGGKFVQAPMKHFLRFDGAVGTHAGYLPGYAASHGCVRMPPVKAALFYNIAEVGTPVKVFGKAPPGGPPEIKSKAAATPAPTPAPTPPRKWYQIFRYTPRQ